MKEQYIINARIIDPKNQIDEIGGLIIDEKGLIKAKGKSVSNGNIPNSSGVPCIVKSVKVTQAGLFSLSVKVKEDNLGHRSFSSMEQMLGQLVVLLTRRSTKIIERNVKIISNFFL